MRVVVPVMNLVQALVALQAGRCRGRSGSLVRAGRGPPHLGPGDGCRSGAARLELVRLGGRARQSCGARCEGCASCARSRQRGRVASRPRTRARGGWGGGGGRRDRGMRDDAVAHGAVRIDVERVRVAHGARWRGGRGGACRPRGTSARLRTEPAAARDKAPVGGRPGRIGTGRRAQAHKQTSADVAELVIRAYGAAEQGGREGRRPGFAVCVRLRNCPRRRPAGERKFGLGGLDCGGPTDRGNDAS